MAECRRALLKNSTSMDKIKCSAPILTLNCAKNLEKCLESIRDLSDIVILDGNSTDGTQEVASRYGAKVFPQFDAPEPNRRITDFTAMRKKALEKISEQWMLCIDSDEWADAALIEEIGKIISANTDPKIAYKIPRYPVINGAVKKYYIGAENAQVRLYHLASGIRPNEGKVVHETDFIPDDVEQRMINGAMYTEWPSARELMEKDDYYLGLVKGDLEKGLPKISIAAAIRKTFVNVVKAAKIFVRSLDLYRRHGFKETLPMAYNWRFMRYHFLLAKMVLDIKLNTAKND